MGECNGSKDSMCEGSVGERAVCEDSMSEGSVGEGFGRGQRERGQ